MSNNTILWQQTISAHGRRSQNSNPTKSATHWYARMWYKAKVRRWWGKLTGQRQSLLSLKEVAPDHQVTNRHHRGLQTVPLTNIKGSEGRCTDFDTNFYPTHTHSKARWINIAALRLAGKPLPPVQLIQIGDLYFVRDGHHRISVAHWLGQQAIEAQVVY